MCIRYIYRLEDEKKNAFALLRNVTFLVTMHEKKIKKYIHKEQNIHCGHIFFLFLFIPDSWFEILRIYALVGTYFWSNQRN